MMHYKVTSSVRGGYTILRYSKEIQGLVPLTCAKTGYAVLAFAADDADVHSMRVVDPRRPQNGHTHWRKAGQVEEVPLWLRRGCA
jgi:hypothetical protein